MEKLVVLIIILVAVLSTPLTLKKLIDQVNRRKSELLNDSNAQPNVDSNAQPNVDSNAPSSKTYKTYDDDDDWPNDKRS